jgi:hypothetical protein
MNKTLSTLLTGACCLVFIALIWMSYAPAPDREPSKILPYVAVTFLLLAAIINRAGRKKGTGKNEPL